MQITDYFTINSTFHQKRAVEAHLAHMLIYKVPSVAMGTFWDFLHQYRNHYSWLSSFFHVLKTWLKLILKIKH